MFISFKLKWVLRWLKRLLFKTKNTLPESPKQEIPTSSNTSDVVLQTLDVKEKQEQMKFFEKANDLRDVVFDLNPVWDNHSVQLSCKDDIDAGIENATIRAVKIDQDEYKDEVGDSYSPWNDFKRFPRKNYNPTTEELNQLKLTEDGNNNSNAEG